MRISREILIGKILVAELVADREVQVVDPRESRKLGWPFSVACMVMEHGVNVCVYDRHGVPLNTWGKNGKGHQLVEWPMSPLSDDYTAYCLATRRVLMPVVDCALDAIEAVKAQQQASANS